MFKTWFLNATTVLKAANKGGKGQKEDSILMRVPMRAFDDLNQWMWKWEEICKQGQGPRYDQLKVAMLELQDLMNATNEQYERVISEKLEQTGKGGSEATLEGRD